MNVGFQFSNTSEIQLLQLKLKPEGLQFLLSETTAL